MRSEKTGRDRADAERAHLDELVEARARRAAEHLVDDERLRRNLTDEQFGPLLEWALHLVDRGAEATVGQSDEAAERSIDRILVRLRETLAEVDRLAGTLGAVGASQMDRLIAGVVRTRDPESGRRIVLERADDARKDTAKDRGSP